MANKDGTKSGGRKKGTPNKSTASRQAQMMLVNEALAAMGEDTLTGTRLLREVLNHKDAPLDVKIQCAGLLQKHEQETATNTQYIATMPPALPGDTPQQQLAVWQALYMQTENDDPEWTEACKRVLEMGTTKKKPETLQ